MQERKNMITVIIYCAFTLTDVRHFEIKAELGYVDTLMTEDRAARFDECKKKYKKQPKLAWIELK
jgi:hypothetical protein